MLRHLFLHRLYYVLPDEAAAGRLVSDLELWGVSPFRIHAIAGQGEQLRSLLPATVLQRGDFARILETLMWYGNVLLFALAVAGLVLAISAGSMAWAAAAVFVMIATAAGGTLFAIYVPHTHIDEFRSALSHREILLLIDVPRWRKAEVETLIEHHHPAAVAGGVGWAVEGLRI
jgi:hypothetical protein